MTVACRSSRLPAFARALSQCVSVAFAVLALLPSTAQAQWRVGAFLGGEHDSSWEEFAVIGADIRGAIGTRNLEFNPRLSYFLRDGMTRIQLDANFIKPLVLANRSRLQPFVGVGVALESVSFDNPNAESETNLGYNYIVGGTFLSTGTLQPYAQFVYSVLHEAANTAVISAGIHIKLGQARR